MDTVVQQNASLVEEAAAATESMKDQAGTLLELVSRFRLQDADDSFASSHPAVLQAALVGSSPSPGPIKVRARGGFLGHYMQAGRTMADKSQAQDSRWNDL
jgi:methyl-accepting chemotaxis protein